MIESKSRVTAVTQLLECAMDLVRVGLGGLFVEEIDEDIVRSLHSPELLLRVGLTAASGGLSRFIRLCEEDTLAAIGLACLAARTFSVALGFAVSARVARSHDLAPPPQQRSLRRRCRAICAYTCRRHNSSGRVVQAWRKGRKLLRRTWSLARCSLVPFH